MLSTPLHRRTGALLLTALLHAAAAAQAGADPLAVTEVAPGVYVHAGVHMDAGGHFGRGKRCRIDAGLRRGGGGVQRCAEQ